MWDENWAHRAACRETPDEQFVKGAEQNFATDKCFACPVRTECLAEALDARIEWGVWGGMTERERRALLRKRPNVTSWRRLLETARGDYERRVAAGEPVGVSVEDQQAAVARKAAQRRAVARSRRMAEAAAEAAAETAAA